MVQIFIFPILAAMASVFYNTIAVWLLFSFPKSVRLVHNSRGISVDMHLPDLKYIRTI